MPRVFGAGETASSHSWGFFGKGTVCSSGKSVSALEYEHGSTTRSPRRRLLGCHAPPRWYYLSLSRHPARQPNDCGTVFFFVNFTATTEIYTLSLHDHL